MNADLRSLYLDLLKKSVADALHRHSYVARPRKEGGVEIVLSAPEDAQKRLQGLDWPACAETMIGLKRLDNLQACIERVVEDGVPGDLIETGVWRGGATIFMRGALRAHGETERIVWVADSFSGLPPPNSALYPADSGDAHHTVDFLAVSEDEVRENFKRYGLLDDQVKFLRGWFKDTLPTVKDRTWAVMRLDGDMYESTIDALSNLYPGLSPGGYVIIDDYGCLPNCKQAVDDYRKKFGITEPIEEVDWTGVFWRKERS